MPLPGMFCKPWVSGAIKVRGAHEQHERSSLFLLPAAIIAPCATGEDFHESQRSELLLGLLGTLSQPQSVSRDLMAADTSRAAWGKAETGGCCSAC